MGRRLVAVLGVLACGLAACSVDSGQPEPPPRERAVPVDRDEPAILATLRGLDPCALLDPAATGAPTAFPATVAPVRTGPRHCEIRGGPEVAAGVTVGTAFGTEARVTEFAQEPIAGAKAYLPRAVQPGDPCVLHVPVSFGYSVSFSVFIDAALGVDQCTVVRGLAGAAIPKLAEPAGITAAPPLPLAAWDVCALLRDAIATGAPAAAGQQVRVTEDDGVDRCYADPPDGPGYGFSLRLRYDVLLRGGTAKTIGGKTVDVFEFDDCEVSWTDGPVATGSTAPTEQVVAVGAPDCDTAEAVAAAVLAKMGGDPKAEVRPWQRSLTYRPDEPDMPAAG